MIESLLSLRIQTPWPRAGCREVEPQKTVEYGVRALVENRPETLRCVAHEVREGHLTREEKRDGTREETQKKQGTAEHFKDSGNSY